MYFTTQKRQLEAYRDLKKQERLARCKHAYQFLFNWVLAGVVILAPGLGIAFGWIKG